jgi:ADP-heptose:LPS heptosyltransferase
MQNPRHKIIWAGQTRAAHEPAWEGTGRFFNLGGRTTLSEAAHIIRRAALVICNDSVPLHLAAALRTPVLGIFGPTPPERYGPYPASCKNTRVLVAPEKNLGLLTAASVAAEAARTLLCF